MSFPFVLALASLTAPQEHVVSLGYEAFDTRWNDDTYLGAEGGADFSLVLLPDGTVRVFGYPGASGIQAVAGTFTRLSTAEFFRTSAGIRTDGTIALWGQLTGSLAAIPPLPPGTTYVELDVQDEHAVAIRSDGEAIAWGTNTSGRLDIPPLPPGLVYTKATTGSHYTLALRSDGVIVSAGTGNQGSHLPPPLPPGRTYVDVDASPWDYTLALRDDGQIVAFGNNDFDQLDVPPLPPGMTYTAVEARFFTGAALRSDGAIVGWGNMDYGAILPPAGLSFVAFSLGDNHLLGRLSDGHVLTFGSGANAQCNVPTVAEGRSRIELALNGPGVGSFTLGARSDDGRYEDLIDTLPPFVPPAGLAFTQLAMAKNSRAALRNDGVIQVKGSNASVPSLPAGTTYTSVAGGAEHLLATRSDGALVGWGLNTSGQTTVPALPPGTSYVACAGGGAHTLALRSDGALIAFGSNVFGQTDVPALPPGTTYEQAWAGRDFSIARRSDGELVAFGRNDLGQCDVPALAPGQTYLEIACGDAHVAARRSDGVLVVWGSSALLAGELPPPAGLAYREVVAFRDETVVRLGPAAPASGPALASVEPPVVESLQPGTARDITLTGTALDTVTSVRVDGVLLAPGSWNSVGPGELTLDLPQLDGLGGHRVSVSDGVDTHELPFTLVAPLGPRLEFGSGDPLNVVDRDDGLRVRVGGPVGKRFFLYASLSGLPSTNMFVHLDIGNANTELFRVGSFTMPGRGWVELVFPTASLPVPDPGGLTIFAQGFLFRPPKPFPESNLQSFVLVP